MVLFGSSFNVCDALIGFFLVAQVRLQSQTSQVAGGGGCERYTLDQFALADIKSVLRDQQEGIQVN
jgi:hypothetical protein